MNNLQSYAFDMNMEMKINGNISPLMGATQMRIYMNSTTKVDITNKKSHTKGSMSLMGMSMPMEAYTIDEIQYSKAPMAGWTKETIKDVWNQTNMVVDASKIQEVGVERKQDETIDNVDCYVMYFNPEPEDVLDLMGVTQNNMGGLANQQEFNEAIKNVEIWEWISKKDYTVKKMHMIMEIESEGTGATMDSSFKIYDLNQQFDITLPDAAQDAVDVTATDDMGLLT